MNTRNRIFRASIPSVDVQVLEQEARRLRTAYQAEVLARLAIAIDLNVRCLAYRISAALGLGGTPCR